MTSIEWTAGDDGVLGKTWNPCVGCNKLSPGCKHCYAKAMHARLTAMGQTKYADPFEVVKPWPPHLALPLTWKKGRRVFVNSMSDLFHEDVSDEYIAAVFGVMAACPQHTFQILTKRAERLPRWFAWLERSARECNGGRGMSEVAFCLVMAQRHVPVEDEPLLARHVDAVLATPWPLPNVWMGVSIEDCERSERMEHLVRIPAAVHFLSIEPLLEDLGDLGLMGIVPKTFGLGYKPYYDLIDWVIVGGESGPGARPFALEWARSIVRQCQDAGVAVFVKQLGAHPRDDLFPGGGSDLVKLRSKKGNDMSEWPAELRVREFPGDGR